MVLLHFGLSVEPSLLLSPILLLLDHDSELLQTLLHQTLHIYNVPSGPALSLPSYPSPCLASDPHDSCWPVTILRVSAFSLQFLSPLAPSSQPIPFWMDPSTPPASESSPSPIPVQVFPTVTSRCRGPEWLNATTDRAWAALTAVADAKDALKDTTVAFHSAWEEYHAAYQEYHSLGSSPSFKLSKHWWFQIRVLSALSQPSCCCTQQHQVFHPLALVHASLPSSDELDMFHVPVQS
eukprot:3551876-Rhodomonas_salina.3